MSAPCLKNSLAFLAFLLIVSSCSESGSSGESTDFPTGDDLLNLITFEGTVRVGAQLPDETEKGEVPQIRELTLPSHLLPGDSLTLEVESDPDFPPPQALLLSFEGAASHVRLDLGSDRTATDPISLLGHVAPDDRLLHREFVLICALADSTGSTGWRRKWVLHFGEKNLVEDGDGEAEASDEEIEIGSEEEISEETEIEQEIETREEFEAETELEIETEMETDADFEEEEASEGTAENEGNEESEGAPEEDREEDQESAPEGDLEEEEILPTFIIPDTSQTTCYTALDTISCEAIYPESSGFGQDGQFNPPSRTPWLEVEESGNVVDHVTGLRWSRCLAGKTGENCEVGEVSLLSQSDAEAYCANRTSDDRDWRLPTLEELNTLVHSDREEPALNPLVFPNDAKEVVWSSTLAPLTETYAWTINFNAGYLSNSTVDNLYRVRCVSGEIWGESRYVTKIREGDRLVADVASGLDWQGCPAGLGGTECASGETLNLDWIDALNYCAWLDFAGFSDWRLPDRNELHSLLDYSRVYPSISLEFPGFDGGRFWSSTSLHSFPVMAWHANFSNGGLGVEGKPSLKSVRCVRSDTETPLPDGDFDESEESEEELEIPPPSYLIPDAGQSHCYDPYNNSVSCETIETGDPGYGQDGHYRTPARQKSYVDPGDGTLQDQVMGLTWTKCQGGVSGSDCQTGGHALSTFAEATAACESLTLGGHDDWRLPTFKELAALSDADRTYPAIDLSIFPNHSNYWFWTSTEYPNLHTVLGLNFGQGYGGTLDREATYHWRCVRGSVWGAPEFVRSTLDGDRVVLDTGSGLIWQECPAGRSGADCLGGETLPFSWTGALDYCESLVLGGRDDWRLPDRLELLVLLDHDRPVPMISPLFPAMPEEAFWTSSTILLGPDFAWQVSFEGGIFYSDSKGNAYPIRCVCDEI